MSDHEGKNHHRRAVPRQHPGHRGLHQGGQRAQPGNGGAPASAFRDQPLVSDIYTADPSAHVFGGKIYVYPSHDIATPTPDDDLGNQYAMRDYRVLSMDRIGGKVKVARSRST
jgi:hypothetical protein